MSDSRCSSSTDQWQHSYLQGLVTHPMSNMDLDPIHPQEGTPPPPPPASLPASSLECDLSHRTAKLLERIAVLPTDTTTANPTATVIRPDAHSSEHWVPLIPLPDLVVLLSSIPQAQLPANLPFSVNTATPTPAVRSQLLDTLARLALESALTVEVISLFRPLAVALVGRWVDLLGLSEDGTWREGEPGVEMAQGEKDAVDRVWRAVVRVLPLLGDEAMPYVLLSVTLP